MLIVIFVLIVMHFKNNKESFVDNTDPLTLYNQKDSTTSLVNLHVTDTLYANSINLIPSGMIIMWNGIDIPIGWKLCDGTNNTPDLRSRFVLASDGNKYPIGTIGGSEAIVLTIDQIPNHSHTIVWDNGCFNNSRPPPVPNRFVMDTKLGLGNKESPQTGKNKPHENRPPYYALTFIMKS